MKKTYILFFVLIVVSLGGFFFFKEGILPLDKNSQKTKIFVINKGETLNEIIRKLANQDLIRNRVVFYLIVKQLGIEKKIQAGDFRLAPSMTAYEIANNLTHGTLDNWITIIEGLRQEEIAQIISSNFDIPETEFLKYTQEGYLFPDTYLIPREATSGSIVEILTNNYHQRFDKKLITEAKKNSLSEKEVLILASLVEKEGKYYSDKQKVAGILLKRLKNDWPLQLDATIQYALGYQADSRTWWKKNLTADDLEIASPYNTYENNGLPPGPICNPGLESIKAVIYADKNTPFWYYISDKEGVLHFAKTLEEHNSNISKYLEN